MGGGGAVRWFRRMYGETENTKARVSTKNTEEGIYTLEETFEPLIIFEEKQPLLFHLLFYSDPI